MNTQKVFAAAAILAAAGTTFAQVSPGAFAPSSTEDYEATGGGRVVLNDIFGGLVPVIPGAVTHNSVNAGDWIDFRGGNPVVPSSGGIFGVQFGFGDFTLDFTGLGGITGFACNATAAGVGADMIEFFDMAGNPMTGTVTDPDGFGPGDGTMEALSFVSAVPIGSIRLTGRETCFDDIAISSDGIAPCIDWTNFSFGDVGDVVTFDFDITAGCPTFKITDAFLSGDEFDVRILDGATEVAAFSTSPDPTVGDSEGDFDIAFDDPRWSSGFVNLDTGSYTAEVTVTASPFGSGGAGWRTDVFLAPPCPVVEGDFDADETDDYESYPGARSAITAVFGGAVPIIDGSVFHASVDEGNWSDFRAPGGPIQPTSGTKFGVQFGFGDFSYDFSGIGGILGFKGNASAAGVGDDVVSFFDMDDNLLCSFTVSGGFGPGDGTMVPFSYVSDTPIGRVNVNGRESTFDDIGFTVGEPVCVADCDGDGALTLFDFLCFQNLFDAGDLAADLDGDGILTLFDFLTFQNLFDAGCD